MASENRFLGLIGGLNQSASNEVSSESKAESKPKSKPKSKKAVVKSKDPNYTQIGIYLPNELHRRMKIGAAIAGVEMSDLAAEAVELWLTKNAPNI